MPIELSAVESILILVVCVLGYYWFLYKKGAFAPKEVPVSSMENILEVPDLIPRELLTEGNRSLMSLPPHSESLKEYEEIDDSGFEILEDENMALLKEAEIVVDRIQDTLNNIASNPPNPEEVSSKIRAIISPYQIFLETEYFDSINTYIALSVERDCGIKLTKTELQSLWN
ncbi:hypothetical protein [Chitinophaga niabensis]|uniref:Uncharacterized protein n=1 Tax=Chitinophaga niabensis TaxID=536979 RepID=A0A1N6KB57_9BACT|nr:hypothetical protein [Chitinophaga niabensis]SIO53792.1 hypothetical protein SAMN04488055_5480 [Chitinophaga niabensis]